MILLPRSLFAALVFLGLVLSARAAPPVPASAGPSPAYTRTIYLIRHGAYDMTPGDESTANGLTPLGIAEARLVAARLRGVPVEFTSLTSSTLTRARQTAQVIGQMFPSLQLQTTPLLRETLPRVRGMDLSGQAAPADLDANEAQLNQAFATYFIPAKDRDENDIIVCHGNVIRYLVMKALGVDSQAWAGLSVAHCSLTIIQVSSSGTCKVLAVGDTGHLPPNLLSGYSRTNPELVAPASAP